jgi:hypothetical protein
VGGLLNRSYSNLGIDRLIKKSSIFKTSSLLIAIGAGLTIFIVIAQFVIAPVANAITPPLYWVLFHIKHS